MTDNIRQLPVPKRKPASWGHDWEEIERDYRAGVKSICQIAREQGISDGAIHSRARRRGWERDLRDQVQQRAKAKLARQAALDVRCGIGRTASSRVKPEEGGGGTAPRLPAMPLDDREIVELGAEAILHVVRGHRSDLIRLHRTLSRLHAPLEAYLDALEAATDGNTAPPLPPGLAQILGPRDSLADLATKLIRALSLLIPLERKAFGIDEAEPDAPVDKATLDANDRAILADYRAAVAREILQDMAPQ